MISPSESNRPILCVDVESNGLYGEGFAVGAVVLGRRSRNVLDKYVARCPIAGDVNHWVAENVLPALADLPETHETASAMRSEFWGWYALAWFRYEPIVVVDCGWPVEARFFLDCLRDEPARAQEAPYPLHDLATLLHAHGHDPRAFDRMAYVLGDAGKRHHPFWDALASAILTADLLDTRT